MGAIYALVAIADNVMFSASRVLSFTSGVLSMLGGGLGAVFISRLGLPVLPGLLATLAVCALFGVVTEIVAVRPVLGRLDQHLYALSPLALAPKVTQLWFGAVLCSKHQTSPSETRAASLPHLAAPWQTHLSFPR
jgi:branched-chain amino acid transport system permease protein